MDTAKLEGAFLKESSGVPPVFQEWFFEIDGTSFLLPQEPKKSQTDRKGTFKNWFLFSQNLICLAHATVQYWWPGGKRESISSSSDVQFLEWWQRNACTMALLGWERGSGRATVMVGWQRSVGGKGRAVALLGLLQCCCGMRAVAGVGGRHGVAGAGGQQWQA